MSAPGWQPDPAGRYEYRWWNGVHWTGDVVQHGVPTVDPWPVEQVGQPVPPPGMPPPAPTPPLAPAMLHPLAPAPPPTSPSRSTALIIGGVVAVVALAIGAFLLLGDDDSSTTPASSTGVATTVVTSSTDATPASTLAPSSTSATTALPTTAVATTLVVDPLDALYQAMPTVNEVPGTWSIFDESGDAEPADTGGYCGGPNWAGLAQSGGSTAAIHGPNWDLPDGGWFGLSAFTFTDEAAASAFIASIDAEANGCMTDPVNYTRPESDIDLFVAGQGDNAVWNIAEVNGSFPGVSPIADEMTLVIDEEIISTTDDGLDYSVTRTDFQRFERHGRTVVVFWLFGEHDQTGFSSGVPEWAYTPSEASLDAAIAAIRDIVVGRLAAAGLA